jgi:hypothetical protein
VSRFTRQTLPNINRKHFMNILFVESFCTQKKGTTESCSSVLHSSSTVAILTTETCWTVLLPSDTHIKPITFITAVLLPFVTYLLILNLIYIL